MYQNDDKSSYEYHYSYRSDSEGFRPDQTPAPMELQKPKRGRAKRLLMAEELPGSQHLQCKTAILGYPACIL